MSELFKGKFSTKSAAGEFDTKVLNLIEPALKSGIGARVIALVLITNALQLLFYSTRSVPAIMQVVFFAIDLEIAKRVPADLFDEKWFLDGNIKPDDEPFSNFSDDETEH